MDVQYSVLREVKQKTSKVKQISILAIEYFQEYWFPELKPLSFKRNHMYLETEITCTRAVVTGSLGE